MWSAIVQRDHCHPEMGESFQTDSEAKQPELMDRECHRYSCIFPNQTWQFAYRLDWEEYSERFVWYCPDHRSSFENSEIRQGFFPSPVLLPWGQREFLWWVYCTVGGYRDGSVRILLPWCNWQHQKHSNSYSPPLVDSGYRPMCIAYLRFGRREELLSEHTWTQKDPYSECVKKGHLM